VCYQDALLYRPPGVCSPAAPRGSLVFACYKLATWKSDDPPSADVVACRADKGLGRVMAAGMRTVASPPLALLAVVAVLAASLGPAAAEIGVGGGLRAPTLDSGLGSGDGPLRRAIVAKAAEESAVEAVEKSIFIRATPEECFSVASAYEVE
jgi:hypothetical protein